MSWVSGEMNDLVGADLPRVDQLPAPRRGLLEVLQRPAARLLHAWWDLHIHHTERIPAGPVVLAANHLGVIDGVLLVVCTRRLTFALAKEELFRGKGRSLHLIGQVPVVRSRPDPQAIRRSVRVLRDGHALAVFPEGGRSAGEMAWARGGAAYLAMVTGAPIVPVALLGTRQPGRTTTSVPPKGAPMHVVFGHPLSVPRVPWPRRRDAVAELTERMRLAGVAHLADAQRLTGMPLPGPPAPTPPRPQVDR